MKYVTDRCLPVQRGGEREEGLRSCWREMAEGSQNGLLGSILWLNEQGLVFDKKQLSGSYGSGCDCTLTSAGLDDLEWGVWGTVSDIGIGIGIGVALALDGDAPVVIWDGYRIVSDGMEDGSGIDERVLYTLRGFEATGDRLRASVGVSMCNSQALAFGKRFVPVVLELRPGQARPGCEASGCPEWPTACSLFCWLCSASPSRSNLFPTGRGPGVLAMRDALPCKEFICLWPNPNQHCALRG